MVGSRRAGRWALAGMAVLAIAAAGYWASRIPDPPDAVWEQARSAFEGGRLDEAEAALARLAKLREPTTSDWFLRAQLLVARGNLDAAIEALGKVPESHPAAAQSALEAGQIELRRNRAREAERWYRRALAIEPEMKGARRELIYILGTQLRRRELADQFEALDRSGMMSFDDAYLWGLSASGLAWEPGETVKLLGQYVKADPADRASRLSLVEDLRRLSGARSAEPLLAPLPDSDPDARALRVVIALDLGDIARAEALLAEGPADHAGLERLRGRSALARGRIEEAVDHFRAACRVDPCDRESVIGLGQSLQRLDLKEEAQPWLARAKNLDLFAGLLKRANVEQYRNDPAFLRGLGTTSEAAGRVREARAWFRLAIALNPLDAEAQRALFRLNANSQPVKSLMPRPKPVDETGGSFGS